MVALAVRSFYYQPREYLVAASDCTLIMECDKMRLWALVQQKSH